MELRIHLTSKETGVVEERRLALDGKAIAGRGAESALVLDANAISREHFALEANGGEVIVTDLSANGTSINGAPLRKGGRQALKPGDVIGVPGFDLSIEPAGTGDSGGAPAPAAPEAAGSGANSLAAGARGFIGSFTRMERFLAMLSLAALGLVGVYWAS